MTHQDGFPAQSGLASLAKALVSLRYHAGNPDNLVCVAVLILRINSLRSPTRASFA